MPSLRLPLRFLRGHHGRLALTVVAIASGVAQVSGNELVSAAALRGFVDVIDTAAGRAALQVSAGEGAPFPDDVATAVARVAGVERVVPVVEINGVKMLIASRSTAQSSPGASGTLRPNGARCVISPGTMP